MLGHLANVCNTLFNISKLFYKCLRYLLDDCKLVRKFMLLLNNMNFLIINNIKYYRSWAEECGVNRKTLPAISPILVAFVSIFLGVKKFERFSSVGLKANFGQHFGKIWEKKKGKNKLGVVHYAYNLKTSNTYFTS